MKLSQWRPAFKRFIIRYVDISGYGVAEPDEYGIFLAHLPPLTDVEYTRSPPDIVQSSATQHLYLLARYNGETPYRDLPIGALEGLHSNLSLHCLLEHSKLTDATLPTIPLLISLSAAKVSQPVRVEELSYANKDWLAVVEFVFDIAWYGEPETTIGTILLQGLNLEVYRSTIADINTATLDITLNL